MANAGAVNIRLGATTNQFEQAMQSAQASIRRLNSAIQSVQGNGSFGSSLISQMESIGKSAQNVGTKLSASITLPLGLAATGALKMAGDMEMAEVAFTTMLGSADKAKTTLEGLKEFAAQTPFEFPEVQQAAKSLLAFGLSAEQLQPTLKALGDVSSGVGAPIGEIADIYGKARVQGRLFSEDINQLTGRGIPIIQELAKQFGVTDDQVKKLVEDGKVNFSNLEKAFISLTSNGGKFTGLMAAQSQTLPGLFSTMKDTIGQSMAEVGKEIATAFNLKEIIPKVAGWISTATNAFKNLSPEVKRAGIIIAGIVAAAGPVLLAFGGFMSILPTLQAGFAALRVAVVAATGPWGLIAAAVVAAVGLIIANWDKIKKVLIDSGVWDTMQRLVSAAIDFVKAAFSALVNHVQSVWNQIAPTVEFFFKNIVAIAKIGWGAVAGIFNAAGGILTGALKAITGLLTADWSKFKEGLQNITASIWNGIIDIFNAGIKLTGGLFVSFLDVIGMDTFAETLRKGIDKVTASVGNLKIQMQGVAQAAKQTTSTVQRVNSSTGNAGVTKPSLAAGLGSTDNKSKQSAKKKKDNKDADIKSLSGKTIEDVKNAYVQSMSSMAIPELPNLAENLKAWGESASKGFRSSTNKLIADAEIFIENLSNTLEQAAPSAMQAVGDFIGGLIAGTAKMQDFPKVILGVLGDTLNALGQALAASGAAMLFIPGLQGQAAAQLAGSVGLFAAGALAKSLAQPKTQAFADGGIVYGPTMGLVGEYPGARSNPEVIAPLSKLRDIVGTSGMAGGKLQIEVQGRIRGNDLDIIGARTKRANADKRGNR